MKLPTVLFMLPGIALVVWGVVITVQEIDFDMHAEEAIATVASVGNGRLSSRNSAPKVIGVYTANNTVYKERLALPVFSTTLGFDINDRVRVMYDERSPEDAKIITQSWDRYLYYVAGIFFGLFGLVLMMFGIMTEKNLSKK